MEVDQVAPELGTMVEEPVLGADEVEVEMDNMIGVGGGRRRRRLTSRRAGGVEAQVDGRRSHPWGRRGRGGRHDWGWRRTTVEELACGVGKDATRMARHGGSATSAAMGIEDMGPRVK